MLKVCGVRTPVVVVSAHLDDGRIRRLEELGINHFLAKPFSVDELLSAVEAAVADSPA